MPSLPNTNRMCLHGAGLGLRRAIIGPFSHLTENDIDFIEVAPENWINVGGRFGKQFCAIAERFPVSLHGLSLNLGGFADLDMNLLRSIKNCMREHNCEQYSEHLSYCADDGHLYDLMPIPFTEEAVKVVAARIRQVQDFLGQRIAIETVSYHAAPYQQVREIDFLIRFCNRQTENFC
jgi:uncharacterized protein (UPF0276 family)